MMQAMVADRLDDSSETIMPTISAPIQSLSVSNLGGYNDMSSAGRISTGGVASVGEDQP
jgi:hypothetical protein